MPYKPLQQLREEQQAHHDRAMRLLEEAAEIIHKMKYIADLREYVTLQKQWIKKDAQARAEIEKSIELSKQFIEELERLNKRGLN